MACEVAAAPCRWMFTPQDISKKITAAVFARGGTREERENHMAQLVPPFQFTPLHDLEPLLWMIIWTFDARPLLGGALTQQQTDSLISIFNGEVPTTSWLVYSFKDNPIDASSKHRFLVNTYIPWAGDQEQIEPSSLWKLVETITTAHQQLQGTLDEGRLKASAYADHAAPRLVVAALRELADAVQPGAVQLAEHDRIAARSTHEVAQVD
jgi:hypothetical protein